MKKLIVVGSQKNYIKINDLRGFDTVIDMPVSEFSKLNFDITNTVIAKGIVETADIMRVILNLNKKLGGGALSHCAVFKRDDIHPFILTDGALNIAPDVEMKKIITQNAIDFCKKINISQNPMINFLTPTSNLNPKIKSCADAEILEKYFSDFDTNHFSFDVCFSEYAKKVKGIINARHPDILVCDDIDQGNAIWKALTVFGNFNVAGFIVGGNNLPPVVLNSRSDSLGDKLWSLTLLDA